MPYQSAWIVRIGRVVQAGLRFSADRLYVRCRYWGTYRPGQISHLFLIGQKIISGVAVEYTSHRPSRSHTDSHESSSI